MQATPAEKARLGVFIILAVSALALVLFFMVGRSLLTGFDSYYVRFSESITGLERGAPVRQNGLVIGSVIDIRTDPKDLNQTLVRFQVNEGSPIKTDMTATLGTFGITGLKFIDITGGSYASPDLPEDGVLESSPSTLGLLEEKAISITAKIDTLLANVIRMTSSDNRETVNRLIENGANVAASMDTLVRDLANAKPGVRLESTLITMEGAAKDLRTKIQALDLQRTLGEFEKAAESVGEVARKMDLTMMRIQDDLARTMSNSRETMRNLNDFSRQIKDNPSVLLRGEDRRERRQ